MAGASEARSSRREGSVFGVEVRSEGIEFRTELWEMNKQMSPLQRALNKRTRTHTCVLGCFQSPIAIMGFDHFLEALMPADDFLIASMLGFHK